MANTDLGKVSLSVGGAWSAEQAYEKLTVVTDSGSGFVSKCAVPAGTPLTNTQYWLKLAEKGSKGDTGAVGPQGPQGPAGASEASDVSYSLISSSLHSNNVQDAIDELDAKVQTNKDGLERIDALLPAQVSTGNQLADKGFVTAGLETKPDKDQGVSNAGKAMIVGADGILTPKDTGFSVIADVTQSEEEPAAVSLTFDKKYKELIAWVYNGNTQVSAEGSPYIGAMASAPICYYLNTAKRVLFHAWQVDNTTTLAETDSSIYNNLASYDASNKLASNFSTFLTGGMSGLYFGSMNPGTVIRVWGR